MTILVTGGAGYIGSHTVKELRSRGREVIVLDSLERGHHDALLGADLVVGDISNEDLVENVCRDHRVTDIVHFAAYKSVSESMERPGLYWRNNVQGTVHLLEGALRAGVRRLVFSSSASVYGNPIHSPINETAPIQPESVYAETKAVMERVISWYGKTHGLQWASLRYFNAAGAATDGTVGEEWSITTNLIPLVMKAVLGAGGPLQVFGNDYPTPDGTGIRDYIHVDDLATAHVAAVDHLVAGKGNVTMNLGTGRGSSVLEVMAATERATGKPVPHRIVPRRPGDPATVFADTSLAERVLGWKATRGLDEIVSSAYAWHSRGNAT